MADTTGKTVQVVVVTPEKAVLDATADMVILPMFDGELGVLPGRAPIIGRLGAGELRLKSAAGVDRWYIEPGFVQVRKNPAGTGTVVTVLTGKAAKAAEITTALAEKAATDAAALPAGNAVERASKARARERAQGMKKVAGRNATA